MQLGYAIAPVTLSRAKLNDDLARECGSQEQWWCTIAVQVLTTGQRSVIKESSKDCDEGNECGQRRAQLILLQSIEY